MIVAQQKLIWLARGMRLCLIYTIYQAWRVSLYVEGIHWPTTSHPPFLL
jgi:hypothetical protein